MTRPVKFCARQVPYHPIVLAQHEGANLGRSCRDRDDGPRDEIEHDPVLDGEGDERVRGQGLEDELSNVDDRSQP